MKNPIKKALASSFGAAFLASSIVPAAVAASNPFSAVSMDRGYEIVGYGSKSPKKGEEGGCGEGEKKGHDESSCGEGKRGDDKKAKEAACGEGKCGG